MNEVKSYQSEIQLLGSMFLAQAKDSSCYNPACVPAVLEIIRDNVYFTTPENRMLFDLLVEVHTEGINPDLIILKNRLEQKGLLAAIGGMDYLVQVAEAVATSANYALHAKYVRDCYFERTLSYLADGIKKAVAEPGSVMEKFHAVENDFAELQKELKPQTDTGSDGVGKIIDDTIAGRRQVLKTCWPMMDNLTRALMPNTLTLLCGNPGASKSFMLLQLLSHFIETNIPAAILELEESREYHTLRALAQRCNLAGITDPDWIQLNPIEAKGVYTENEVFVGKISRVINSVDSQWTFSQIAGWIRKKARDGCKFIGVDPITAAQNTTRELWSEHNEFLQTVKQIAVEYGCSLLFVTHPVKAVSFPDLNQLAGSAAFGRFCQCALWLEYIESTETDVKTALGTIPTKYNRVLHILKAGNGFGQGLRLACNFDAGLNLRELGLILKKKSCEAGR